jgi:hypothetical protein
VVQARRLARGQRPYLLAAIGHRGRDARGQGRNSRVDYRIAGMRGENRPDRLDCSGGVLGPVRIERPEPREVLNGLADVRAGVTVENRGGEEGKGGAAR